ncbi:hypothetical protein K438DRAFT_1874312 [Mycena galopus ATCC 62051]|nr:hypothetical protein K438DRAFT_1874312 [Mycena galopus ATCC 62051]
MVRWKGYGPEHNKWVKHSNVFAKDAINTYYRRYPNAPRRIASAAFDSLSFRKRDAHVRFMHRDTAFQGGVMSGEPPVRPLVRSSVRLRPITLPRYLVRSFVQRPFRVRPRPSVRPPPTVCPRPERRPPSRRTPFPFVPLRPATRTGTCYAIKPGITADRFGHV